MLTPWAQRRTKPLRVGDLVVPVELPNQEPQPVERIDDFSFYVWVKTYWIAPFDPAMLVLHKREGGQ